MAKELKAFQEASVEAIVQHFKEHDRALCADEAGLGKTIIARGIISELANEKLDVEAYAEQLKIWWDTFTEKATGLSNDFMRGGRAYHKYVALKEFIENVTGKAWSKNAGTWSAAISESGVSGVIDGIRELNENGEQEKAKAKLGMFLEEVMKLECYYYSKRGVTVPWDVSLEIKEKMQPYRVLYVCCNLAIADQNKSRLVSVPQRSESKLENKPDRLSVLWHYLGNPNPYIEIYSITSTVSAKDTHGSENEREKLAALWTMLKETDIPEILTNKPESAEERKNEINKSEKIKNALREIAEEKTLKEYSPDLIIFDEFQNFADMVNLIKVEEEAFEVYLAELAKAEEDNAKRIESLRRCRKICSGLTQKEVKPKLLFLSATPFHMVDERPDKKRNLNTLALPELVEFMGGDEALKEYKEAKKAGENKKIEEILYRQCGIFRNERIRLMQKNNSAYHLIENDGGGLLSRALAIRNADGNRAAGIVKTTPELGEVEKEYGPGKYMVEEIQVADLARYARLKDIVTAPHSNDVSRTGRCREYPQAAVEQLLWIPPVNPSEPLKGVFAQYAHFSKTLIFSNLKVTPVSVCNSLNKEHYVEGCEIQDCSKLEKWLTENIFSACDDKKTPEESAKLFSEYVQAVGGKALGKNPGWEEVRDYCEAGCLKDVIREYMQLKDIDSETESEYMKLALQSDYSKKIAYCMKQDDLDKKDTTATVRRSFNSPFYPFVLMTTSIGSEGLDFHKYCERLVHYTAPANVIELEQKNGRIDRYHSLAQRRNWSLPANLFAKEYTLEEKAAESGGMIDGWDAGENNLHYYYLYTRYTDEWDKLETLFEEQKKYRMHIGVHHVNESTGLNLCPFLKKRDL